VTTSSARPGVRLRERIAARLPDLPPAQRQVAEYLCTSGPLTAFATPAQIAAMSGTSEATVAGAVRSLGYADLAELRRSLGDLGERPAGGVVGRLEPERRTGALLDRVFDEAAARLATTRRLLDEPRFERAVATLAAAGEVLCFGIGPSQTVAEYLMLRLCRIGRRARAAGSTGSGLAEDLVGLGPGDAVVLFAPGRVLGEFGTLVRHAGGVGARTVLVTDSLDALYGGQVDVVLPAEQGTQDVTGETVTSQVLADALVLGLSVHDPEQAVGTGALMTALRSELVGHEAHEGPGGRP
jgi:DNA-binding MurR/RpiR family transcriptional regulator